MPVFKHQTDVFLRLAPLLALCASLVFGQVVASASAAEKAAVLRVEDAFRLAKLENDTEALGRGDVDVRFAGQNAIVNDTQVEEDPAGREQHLFTRGPAATKSLTTSTLSP